MQLRKAGSHLRSSIVTSHTSVLYCKPQFLKVSLCPGMTCAFEHCKKLLCLHHTEADKAMNCTRLSPFQTSALDRAMQVIQGAPAALQLSRLPLRRDSIRDSCRLRLPTLLPLQPVPLPPLPQLLCRRPRGLQLCVKSSAQPRHTSPGALRWRDR